VQRYFFHITDGTRIIDPEGTLLDGISAAKSEAVHRAGRHLGTSESDEFWLGVGGRPRMCLPVRRKRGGCESRCLVSEPA
jgi:hypothetical protein